MPFSQLDFATPVTAVVLLSKVSHFLQTWDVKTSVLELQLDVCHKFCFDSSLSPEITFLRSVNSFMFIVSGQGRGMSVRAVFNGF